MNKNRPWWWRDTVSDNAILNHVKSIDSVFSGIFFKYVLTFVFQCKHQVLVFMDDSPEDFTTVKALYLLVHYMHSIVVFMHHLLFIVSVLWNIA